MHNLTIEEHGNMYTIFPLDSYGFNFMQRSYAQWINFTAPMSLISLLYSHLLYIPIIYLFDMVQCFLLLNDFIDPKIT